MGFREGTVTADGFDLRYLEAGTGEPLLVMHAARGLRLGPAHDRLAERWRVVALEAPGFGASPANERTADLEQLAATMLAAADALGLQRFRLMGQSFGSKLALWMAALRPERIEALVLVAPTAIRPEPWAPTRIQEDVEPALAAKQSALVKRLFGPPADAALEARMAQVATPTLALFGQTDELIPTALARRYRQLLPACNIVFVYDAGHGLIDERPDAAAEVIGDFLENPAAFFVNRRDSQLSP